MADAARKDDGGEAEPGDEPAAGAGEPDLPVVAYVASFVLYVVLGLLLKSLVLNWIVGPLFLFITLYLLPQALRKVRA